MLTQPRGDDPGINFSLHYTSASHLLIRGASMKAVQEHVGHNTIVMTQRYSHPSREFQREEVNRLNGLFGESGKKLVKNEAGGAINATARNLFERNGRGEEI